MFRLYSWANGSDYHVFCKGEKTADVLEDAWGVEFHGVFDTPVDAMREAHRLGLGVL